MDIDRTFDKIINGTFVISANDGNTSNAMTAAWVMRVSHDPPLVAISVGKRRFTHDIIKRGGCFCINILSDSQVNIAKKFGFSSGRKQDKLSDIAFDESNTGCAILPGICGYLDCELASMTDAGDHTLFIGKVIDYSHSENKPLLADMSDYM